MTTPTRRRSPLLLVPAVGVGLLLAGCSFTNEMTTTNTYASSDGVRVELGELILSNLMVVTAAEGESGTVLGAISNDGGEATEVTLGVGGAEVASFTVPAGSTVLLGPDEQSVDVDAVPAPPGALVDLSVASDRAGSTSAQVPVLDGTFEAYADLVPGSDD